MKYILTIISSVFYLSGCGINPSSAITSNNLEYLRNMPDSEVKKANEVWLLMHTAAHHNNLEALNILYSKGANPNFYSKLLGRTPLHTAVHDNHYRIVKRLLELNVDVNLKNKNGVSPLEISITNGNNAIFDLLMTENVDINSQNINGVTPLVASIIFNRLPMFEKLLNAGADINIRDKNGNTALIEATLRNDIHIVEALIKANSDLNIQNNFGDTALHWAVANQLVELTELLIKAGTNLTLRNSTGATAKDLAANIPALYAQFQRYSESPKSPTPPKTDVNTPPRLVATGSGFSINSKGGFITNHHVINDCEEVSVFKNSKEYDATVAHYDYKNDLAYIVSDDLADSDFVSISPKQQHLGEQLVVLGFPLTSLMGNTIKLTDGSLSSLTGLRGDSSLYQMSAPIQAGNSGGPVFNEQGSVIGVATSSLSAAFMLKHQENVPQNVNFAVKSSILVSFLSANNIAHKLSSNDNNPPKSSKSIYTDNVDSVAMILCFK